MTATLEAFAVPPYRVGLEALLQYALRPPICESHLSRLADGRVKLRLKRPLKTGMDEIVLDPFELMRRPVDAAVS